MYSFVVPNVLIFFFTFAPSEIGKNFFYCQRTMADFILRLISQFGKRLLISPEGIKIGSLTESPRFSLIIPPLLRLSNKCFHSLLNK